MRNKKLIPFEVIEKAVAGEPEAIEFVLQHYSPRIKYLSKYRGYINDSFSPRTLFPYSVAVLTQHFIFICDAYRVSSLPSVVPAKIHILSFFI